MGLDDCSTCSWRFVNTRDYSPVIFDAKGEIDGLHRVMQYLCLDSPTWLQRPSYYELDKGIEIVEPSGRFGFQVDLSGNTAVLERVIKSVSPQKSSRFLTYMLSSFI